MVPKLIPVVLHLFTSSILILHPLLLFSFPFLSGCLPSSFLMFLSVLHCVPTSTVHNLCKTLSNASIKQFWFFLTFVNYIFFISLLFSFLLLHINFQLFYILLFSDFLLNVFHVLSLFSAVSHFPLNHSFVLLFQWLYKMECIRFSKKSYCFAHTLVSSFSFNIVCFCIIPSFLFIFLIFFFHISLNLNL